MHSFFFMCRFVFLLVKHSYDKSLKSFAVIDTKFQRSWDTQTLNGPYYLISPYAILFYLFNANNKSLFGERERCL